MAKYAKKRATHKRTKRRTRGMAGVGSGGVLKNVVLPMAVGAAGLIATDFINSKLLKDKMMSKTDPTQPTVLKQLMPVIIGGVVAYVGVKSKNPIIVGLGAGIGAGGIYGYVKPKLKGLNGIGEGDLISIAENIVIGNPGDDDGPQYIDASMNGHMPVTIGQLMEVG